MDKSQCKWVYPAGTWEYDARYVVWVYEVAGPDPQATPIWLVDKPFYDQYPKHVDTILFVGTDKSDSPHTKLVYVAGVDPYYENWYAWQSSNMPKKWPKPKPPKFDFGL